jgi:hypothetical protein
LQNRLDCQRTGIRCCARLPYQPSIIRPARPPGRPAPGFLSRFSKSCPVHTGHKQENKRYYCHAERKVREAKQARG